MTDNRARNVTITEVAQAAGVSIGTVSRFLNGRPVTDDNRTRIAAQIERLGYRRNALASAMKSAQTGVIGILVPNLDGFHSTLVMHLVENLRQRGLMGLTHCHDNSPESVATALAFFRNYRVDVLVMGGSQGHVQAIRDLIELGTPVVTYDNPQANMALDGVEVDNAGAAALATRHLIEAGHTDIGIIAGPHQLGHETAVARLRGWQDALEHAGLPIQPRLIEEGGWTRVGGAAAMARMLDSGPPPTALFSSSYRMTIGAMATLAERGVRVPDDMSLVSFDDVELFRHTAPPITVVAQPVPEIAAALAQRVVERTRPKDSLASEVCCRVLPCELIVRGSVAAGPNQGLKGKNANAGA